MDDEMWAVTRAEDGFVESVTVFPDYHTAVAFAKEKLKDLDPDTDEVVLSHIKGLGTESTYNISWRYWEVEMGE